MTQWGFVLNVMITRGKNMLKALFEKEREILNHFFEHVDIDAANELLTLLLHCKGMIFFTGVGKSALVAEKISLTMTSTGTRAFFLSAVNALHGDIGIVSKEDVFIMISKSGESDELIHLVPFLRNKGVKLIALVSNKDSRLAKACEMVVVLPKEQELCPFDLAPTTSTVTQLIFGDVLAIALMMQKNFSLMEFAANHPAGKIGRRLILRVKDLMLKGKDIPIAGPNDKLVDMLVELSDKRCGCLLIINKENHLLGIFTDGDLRRALQKHGPIALEMSLEKLMTKKPRWIQEKDMATQALLVMEGDQNHPIMVLPVLNDSQEVVGLIKMHDILQTGL
jgi:arabinose-5-phosphate isomerase